MGKRTVARTGIPKVVLVMKYRELIDAMLPYADEDVDICFDDLHCAVTFWRGGGEDEIATIDVHE